METVEKSRRLVEALELWISSKTPAPMTARAYRYAMARLSRHGIETVSDVKPENVARYLDTRIAQAPGATHIDLAALSSTLGHLERRGEVSEVLLRAVRRVRGPSRRRRRELTARFLDASERLLLLEGAHVTSRRALLLVRLALLSGLRFSELRRARWSEIDLSEKPPAPCLQVLWLPELGQAGRIKTYQRRSVPLCKALREVLAAARPGDGAGFVFPRTARDVSELATERSLRAELAAAAARAGLLRVDFPLLRHTRAATWLQAGVPAAKAAFWLGHTLQVFLQYYGALVEGYDPDCEKL